MSLVLDAALLKLEVDFYRSQFGLQDENSDAFQILSPEKKERARKFFLASAAEIGKLVAVYSTSSAVEEFARYIPFVGSAIASSISFSSTNYFLHCCLNDMEQTALDILQLLNKTMVEDFDID